MKKTPLWAFLLFVVLHHALPPLLSAQSIKNPYYSSTQWRMWATDQTPITDPLLIPPGPVGVLQPPNEANRVYPDDEVLSGKFLEVRMSDWPARKYFGFWDDVYATFDGAHTFLDLQWTGEGGNKFDPWGWGRSIMMKAAGIYDVRKFGLTFTSQSTTGMGHNKANSSWEVLSLEKDYYFANCLRAGPAYISYMDESFLEMNDSYQALVPSFYNSMYASGSEMQAITKMIIAGGYLPASMKTELKRNGLYMAALLYLWKAALPFDAPYDSEIKQRVSYMSNGGVYVFPANEYFHTYNDTEHLRRMVTMAKSMTVAPPVSLLRKVSVVSGTEIYFHKTAALIQQAQSQSVQLRVNVNDSFDLASRPLTYRWSILYGNKNSTIVNEGSGTYLITVPADSNLPRGRTTIVLVANNGVQDSNPAAINVYRPDGTNNKRPLITGIQDLTIFPGQTASLQLGATDPEGFPVSFYKRSDDPGSIVGSTYSWQTTTQTPPGEYPIEILASDNTTGTNSARAKITVTKTIARVTVDKIAGQVPLTVQFSSQGSGDSGANPLTYFWDFNDGKTDTSPSPSHTFFQPGYYRVRLTATGPLGSNTAEVVVEAQFKNWELAIDNGWTTSGLNPSVWSVVNPANGSNAYKTDPPRMYFYRNTGSYGIESTKTFAPPLYLEVDFNNGYGANNDGLEVLGNVLGWNWGQFDLKNVSSGERTPIGNPGLNARLLLKVYITADPQSPDRLRYAGFLETILGPTFFSIGNLTYQSSPIQYLDNAHNTDFYRFGVWTPGSTPPPDTLAPAAPQWLRQSE